MDEHEPLDDEARAKDAKDAERELDDALLWVLADVRGRKVLWWLLTVCGVFRLSMTGNSQTFFNEGMRNVGLALMDRIMRLSPNVYQEMYREARGTPDKGR